MPLQMSVLKKALYDWVTAVTGKKVIWADQDSPQPTEIDSDDTPYLTLRVTTMTPVGQDFWSPVNGITGEAKVIGTRRLTLEINHYGADSMDTCEELYKSLIFPEYQQSLNAVGLTQLNRLPVLNLTGLDDTRYEERARFEALFLVASESGGVDVGVIENVEITAKVKKSDGTIIDERVITVNTP